MGSGSSLGSLGPLPSRTVTQWQEEAGSVTRWNHKHPNFPFKRTKEA